MYYFTSFAIYGSRIRNLREKCCRNQWSKMKSGQCMSSSLEKRVRKPSGRKKAFKHKGICRKITWKPGSLPWDFPQYSFRYQFLWVPCFPRDSHELCRQLALGFVFWASRKILCKILCVIFLWVVFLLPINSEIGLTWR